jgi:hypothetical protein
MIMAQTNAPHPGPAASMKMKTEDIVFGLIALAAIVGLILYMS